MIMKHYSTLGLLKSSLVVMAVAVCQNAQGAWEQVYSHPTTQAHFITSKGTFLLADFDDNRSGGIFISEDKGATWTKTGVKDFNYHKFYEADGYIYAMGYNARIARSSDDGHTWDVLNYSKALDGVVESKDMEALVAYGIVKVDDKLYIADFAGGGVLVSPDNGETWSLTDRESLMVDMEGLGMTMGNFYNLVYFKGYIYAFAALSVHRYDIDADRWEPVDLWSNFMSVSTIFDGRLVCGRAVTNADPEVEYLVYTEDGRTWDDIKAPTPLWEFGLSRNVRALYSDDKYIYTAGPDGLIRNTETPGPEYVNAPDFFYTPDFGETWTHVPGLPARMYPLTLTSDEDYIYVSLYSPIPSNANSGLWRIAKSELTGAGVGSVMAEGDLSVMVSGDMMEISPIADRVTVYNLDGRIVRSACGVSSLDLGMLDKGVYTYEAVSAKGKETGKFVR